MIATINEDICNAKGVSFAETLVVLLIKTGVDISTLFQNMESKGIITKDILGTYKVAQGWDDSFMDVLLTSEKEIPAEDSLTALANALIALYPHGKRPGTASTYWQGNTKDIKLRLKKFYKLYGSKYTNEEIIEATKRYVESFNGDYTYMKVLKYFIWKDARKEDSEGKGYVEESSDLATIISDMRYAKKNGETSTTISTGNNWNLTLV